MATRLRAQTVSRAVSTEGAPEVCARQATENRIGEVVGRRSEVGAKTGTGDSALGTSAYSNTAYTEQVLVESFRMFSKLCV